MRYKQSDDKEWIEYINRFSDEYDHRIYNNSSTGYVMKAGHNACESYFKKDQHFSKVLEVAAGTGEHLKSVKHTFDEYVMTDSDSKALNIAFKSSAEHIKSKVRIEVKNASSLDYPDNTFDRVIATHILEHLYEPHLVIKEWLRVLKPGGTLSILIPTDPGIAWKIGRYFTTRRSGIKLGWNYDYIMAREHVNPCNNLIAFLNYYLKNNNSYFWPFKALPSIDMNLFYIFHANKDDLF